MNTEEFKKGLELLTKSQIVETFGSLELKEADNKSFLIEAVINTDPAAEEAEIMTAKGLIAEAAMKKLAKEPELAIENSEYVAVSDILEDGVLYEKGKPYEGKRAAYFLKGGQIRKRG